MFLQKGIESLPQKLGFPDPYNFATKCHRPSIFQTMNCVRSNNISLQKYKVYNTMFQGYKD